MLRDSFLLSLTAIDCRTVYEPSFAWWFPAAGLGVAVGALVVGGLMDGARRLFTYGIAGLGLLWALGATAALYRFHAEARAAAKSSNTPVVEGDVRDFHPAPWAGHEDESFVVSGVRFAYSDYVITGGFRRTSSHGGPIRQGLRVRVRYLPDRATDATGRPTNLIVRLDICP
jgi:hypothetical protein